MSKKNEAIQVEWSFINTTLLLEMKYYRNPIPYWFQCGNESIHCLFSRYTRENLKLCTQILGIRRCVFHGCVEKNIFLYSTSKSKVGSLPIHWIQCYPLLNHPVYLHRMASIVSRSKFQGSIV